MDVCGSLIFKRFRLVLKIGKVTVGESLENQDNVDFLTGGEERGGEDRSFPWEDWKNSTQEGETQMSSFRSFLKGSATSFDKACEALSTVPGSF